MKKIAVPNPCEKDPCQDQHVCLLSSTEPSGRACKCPDSLMEATDRQTGKTLCRLRSAGQICPLQCNQGLCKIVNGQPKCKCTIDYDGDFCEHYRCSNYCKNRGVCYVDATRYKANNDSAKPPLKCKCSSAWTGDRCETPVANCTSPCYNGVCTIKYGVESCICRTGFTGSECKHCDDLECENDGVCRRDQLGNARCECTKDFKGIRCENSPCEGFCSGHGQCTLHSGTPQCDCDAGYWGRQCESEECTGYCQNGGTCTITPTNDKNCECTPNYSGQRCENELGPNTIDCDRISCENGGTCQIIKGDALCNCTAQFTGQKCQVGYRIWIQWPFSVARFIRIEVESFDIVFSDVRRLQKSMR